MNKKGKQQTLWIFLVLAGAFILVGMLAQKQFGVFSMLPAGSCNIESASKFITNVDPITSRYTSYGNTGVWISADTNGDGIKEKYGKYSSSSGTTTFNSQIYNPIAENYNPEEDDIWSMPGSDAYLWVASDSGYYQLFHKDYGAASNAMITCGTTTNVTCTPNWQCGVWSTCSSSVQTRVCTDSNSCGVTTGKPAESQSCTSGGTCVSFDQLIAYANQWVSCN